MEEFIVKDGKKLRLGYTTGSCAAAASKAAAFMLLTGRRKEKIGLITPKGIGLDIDIKDIRIEEDRVSCSVEKDSGDDPDITRGSLVTATVSRIPGKEIIIDGGKGVGRVTKPGLDQPVGAAAINSVPRQMIRENLEEVCRHTDYEGGLSVVISVDNGEELAKKTFNPRLGIIGGISILGTTGIVEPMSEQALVDTIRVELRQRKESGYEHVLLTPGNYGSDYIKMGLNIDPAIAVMTSNFIGDSIDFCKELGFKSALLVGHIGKLVKIAGNMMNTHSKYGDCRMDILTACAAGCGLKAEKASVLLDCATCDDAIRILKEEQLFSQTVEVLCRRIAFNLEHRAAGMEIGFMTFSKVYGMIGKSKNADMLLNYITEE